MPRFLLPGLIVGVVGCATPDAVDPEAYAASDSAGVRLVRYTREPAVPAWTAVEPATLQLGDEDSFERITGGTLLPDGGVLAADGLAARVTILDSAGGIRQQIGRSGDGPLEFRNLAWARPYAGDSIATFDLALRRLMVFDPAGGPGRVVTLSPTGDGSRPTALGLFTGGEIPVLATGVLYADHLAPGIHAPRTHLWRYAADGRPAAPVRTDLAGAEMVQLESPRILMSRPFGKETAVAAGAALVFVADSGGSLLEAYHADGSLAMLLRLPTAARPVTETHRAAYRRQRLAPLREAGRAEAIADMEATLAQLPWPSHLPAVRRLQVDRDGRLWVERYPEPGEERQRFWVVGTDGVIAGALILPSRTVFLDASGDRVLTRWRDEMDRDYLRIHRIH
jgi:hypothetical protein